MHGLAPFREISREMHKKCLWDGEAKRINTNMMHLSLRLQKKKSRRDDMIIENNRKTNQTLKG